MNYLDIITFPKRCRPPRTGAKRRRLSLLPLPPKHSPNLILMGPSLSTIKPISQPCFAGETLGQDHTWSNWQKSCCLSIRGDKSWPSICEYGFVWELGISSNCNFSTENDDQHPISGDVSAVKEPTSHSTIGWSVWKGQQTQGKLVKCRICHSNSNHSPKSQIIPQNQPNPHLPVRSSWDRRWTNVAWRTGPPHWKIGGVSIPFLTCPGQKKWGLSLGMETKLDV